MKHLRRLSVAAAAVFVLPAAGALAAEPVCSVEFERVSGGAYEWRGTILADDGKLYDFEVATLAEAGRIAALAGGEGGARDAYAALLDMAAERATVATPEAIDGLFALIETANLADTTTFAGARNDGTWSILCFTALDAPTLYNDPVLIERRGDAVGINDESEELRAALAALDPAFAIEAVVIEAGPAPKPR